jgi:hypothetical protein
VAYSSVSALFLPGAMHKPRSGLPPCGCACGTTHARGAPPAAQGIVGVRSSHAAGGAGAIAEPEQIPVAAQRRCAQMTIKNVKIILNPAKIPANNESTGVCKPAGGR